MFIEKRVKKKTKVGFVCDKCKKSYTIEDIDGDWDRCLHIHLVGGYASKIPDMSVVNITICEECFYPFIKDHIK